MRNVAKDNEFGASDAVSVGTGLSDIDDTLPHEGHGVHVNTRAGRPDVNRRANAIGCRQGFGERINEVSFSGRHAFFHEGTEPA